MKLYQLKQVRGSIKPLDTLPAIRPTWAILSGHRWSGLWRDNLGAGRRCYGSAFHSANAWLEAISFTVDTPEFTGNRVSDSSHSQVVGRS